MIPTLIKTYWRPFFTLAVPIGLLPLPLAVQTDAGKCAYAVILMAVFWALELAPLAITSLFPVVLFPLMGILTASDTCMAYLKSLNVLFIGGLMFAVAVEESGLHRRMSLKTLTFMGSDPRRLMFGFMIFTAFLSMWMSNTATTAMMLPIAIAVAREINARNAARLGTEKDETSVEGSTEFKSPAMVKLVRGFMLCICYSATIGGTGTLIGTGTNVVLSGQLDILYHSQTPVTFASWMAFAIPLVILNLIVCWLWLCLLYTDLCSCRNRRRVATGRVTSQRVKELLQAKYRELGPMTFAEIAICVFFFILLFLWIFHDPKFVSGWSSLFKEGYTDDSVCVILIVCILAIFPSKFPSRHEEYPPPLLTWSAVNSKLPWNVVLLVGGGFALAKGVDKSGLAAFLSSQLSKFESFPSEAFVTLTMVIILILTEFTSNVVTASIFLPLLAAVASAIQVNPLFLMIPATLAGSFAFMLPVATPPNAIAFGYGLLRVKDMVIAGSVLNVICLCNSLLAINTWGSKLFHLDTVPDWANVTKLELPDGALL